GLPRSLSCSIFPDAATPETGRSSTALIVRIPFRLDAAQRGTYQQHMQLSIAQYLPQRADHESRKPAPRQKSAHPQKKIGSPENSTFNSSRRAIFHEKNTRR